MDIAIKLHKLIARFEQCVAKFDPAVHKFKFGISYVQDEIQQILQQIDTKDFFAHGANIKLRSLNAYINDVERMINISSTSKDIVIDDNYTYPDTLTYGIKAINDVADVTVKTFFNGQPITHKDIVTPKISKPNNDTVIE